MQKEITILGSTGSIGTQSLEVCANMGYQVGALAAGSNSKLLEQQVRRFRPRLAVIQDESQYQALKLALADLDVQVLAGTEAVCQAATLDSADVVINAIVGIAGLRPTLAALEAGRVLALANKEALITGGELVIKAAGKRGIVPIDSEHSAVFQCLRAGERQDVVGMILTASGGPFAGKTRAELQDVGIKETLAHPNWSMGAKITVDSATMMNKGLELIEAMWLFDLKPEQIEVVVHRQSVLHSAVEFADGSVIGQMSVPDMRGAIQYALTYPRRHPLSGQRLSLTSYGTLTFEKPDLDTFSCLGTCIQAAKIGGLAPCVANGANEQAVALFLAGKIGFLRIGELVAEAVEMVKPPTLISLATIEETDAMAREYVNSRV